jgi:hypothetical protein
MPLKQLTLCVSVCLCLWRASHFDSLWLTDAECCPFPGVSQHHSRMQPETMCRRSGAYHRPLLFCREQYEPQLQEQVFIAGRHIRYIEFPPKLNLGEKLAAQDMKIGGGTTYTTLAKKAL